MRLAVLGAVVTAMLIITTPMIANAAPCDGKLGVSRTVEIDTTGGPGFGFQHYKQYDFLQPGEVVLTFDDGPLRGRTLAVLKALEDQCAKATFFIVGKQAVAYPQILMKIAKQGHSIGNHTWAHKNLASKKSAQNSDKIAIDDIERGISAVRHAVGDKTAPFFRYPFLKDSPSTLKYLAGRNIGVFSTDIDSFDFKRGSAGRLIKRVMKNLKKKGKGILLFHDIQRHTAKAIPTILKQLKANGYKLVHLKPKFALKSLPEFDEKIKGLFKGRDSMAAGRPMSSVIKTIQN